MIRILCCFAMLASGYIGRAASPAGSPIKLSANSVAAFHHPQSYWTASPVGQTAQLLTLHNRATQTGSSDGKDLPVVSLLRDTLGDDTRENDRLLYVWLLPSASRPLTQKLVAAVPFVFWRLGSGPGDVSPRDLRPLLNLNAPQHPVMSEVRRSVLQWAAFDPLMMPVRASSRMYRANDLDDERLKLEETITYLRSAPTAETDEVIPTGQELNTVIARLELRKRLLGGLFDDKAASRYGLESQFDAERIRSRNWELLRQCAEKGGLYFESISLGNQKDQYGLLWFPQGISGPPSGTSLKPIWKLLNIKDPWHDDRLKKAFGHYSREIDTAEFDHSSELSPEHPVTMVPIALYSLNYAKFPLLLVNFRDELQVRRHEVTQRTINEVTSGVIGISHVTNWYYYAGSMLYNLVWSRRGIAVDQSARLDCYSQFRAQLSVDNHLDPQLRNDLMKQADRLLVNPFGVSTEKKAQLAALHYAQIQDAGGADGILAKRLDEERRAELAAFGQSKAAGAAQSALHMATFGHYTQRVSPNKLALSTLDRERRVQYQLDLLGSLVKDGTPPEVAYKADQIERSVANLNTLLAEIDSSRIRQRATVTLNRLKSLSRDTGVQAQCAVALLALQAPPGSLPAEEGQVIASTPAAQIRPAQNVEAPQ